MDNKVFIQLNFTNFLFSNLHSNNFYITLTIAYRVNNLPLQKVSLIIIILIILMYYMMILIISIILI